MIGFGPLRVVSFSGVVGSRQRGLLRGEHFIKDLRNFNGTFHAHVEHKLDFGCVASIDPLADLSLQEAGGML